MIDESGPSRACIVNEPSRNQRSQQPDPLQVIMEALQRVEARIGNLE